MLKRLAAGGVLVLLTTSCHQGSDLSAKDESYVSSVRDEISSAWTKANSDKELIQIGHGACADLASGRDVDYVQDELTDAEMSDHDATVIVLAAIAHYCQNA